MGHSEQKKTVSYEESLDWIHGKLKFGIKPGLRRVEWLLEQLDNPQDKIKGIHIVGTNGKGSTVANLQHILTASGYKVGSFTSPYIVEFRERISVDGQMISQSALMELVDRVYPIVEALPKATGFEPATEFEVITVMMFLYFAEFEPVDVVLVEAGLGGRLDSTNVFRPLLSICPSIGLDHQPILGDTHVAIAREKAGVIKSAVPFLFASDRQDVTAVFEEVCQSVGAPLYQEGVDFSLEAGDYKDKEGNHLSGIVPGLPGRHQIVNASLAIKACLLLMKNFSKLTTETIKTGLATSSWVGRTERITDNLMLDGAHNNESVKALCDLLRDHYGDKQISILVAAIAGKPIESMLDQLQEVGKVTVTTFDYPTALDLSDYPSQLPRVGDFRQWLAQIEPASSGIFYVVTGSLYFISQVRRDLMKKHYSEKI
nr:folylpolyglutamate synthase/dihydrofolate synthase family protein [Streptococcus ovuberis]